MRSLEQIREAEEKRQAGRSVRVDAYVSPEMRARLRRFAVANGISMSVAIYAALGEYLDAWGAK